MRCPDITVILPTYNRRDSLPVAIRSVLDQGYADFELIVVRDGGCDVTDVVRSFADDRMRYVNRGVNRGKAASLNEALECARGAHVAYIDDDDRWYPHHLATLRNALAEHPECGAAYSDLYKTYYRLTDSGRRLALAKVVNVRRDFDRFFLFYFNHVLHVSLVHRRDLLDRTGQYNEHLSGLIDWDITRRLAFFTDFAHVDAVTGEYYAAVTDSDRISVKVRKNPQEYLRNVLQIRAGRPPKPWPKVDDLSIVIVRDRVDDALVTLLDNIHVWTFHPYEVCVVLPPQEWGKLPCSQIFSTRTLAGDPSRTPLDNLSYAVCLLDSKYVATAPPGVEIGDAWVENALARLERDASAAAVALPFRGGAQRPLVLRRETLLDVVGARAQTPEEALAARGLTVATTDERDGPFAFDTLLGRASRLEEDASYDEAADTYRDIMATHGNGPWMRERLAAAVACAGREHEALALYERINLDAPTVDSLLREAVVRKKRDTLGNMRRRLELLESAYQRLEN